MTTISESELGRLVEGIIDDREVIVRNNPIGSEEEILLWMLLGCLVSYLNLSDNETPCFTGKPDAATYWNAVLFVLDGRLENGADATKYLEKLAAPAG
jgi:hypothetical protein